MGNSVSNEATKYIETGCYGPEMVWDAETAGRARELFISATGRDCAHDPGEECFLVTGALKAWSDQTDVYEAVSVEGSRVRVALSAPADLDAWEARDLAGELLAAASSIDGLRGSYLTVCDVVEIADRLDVPIAALLEAAVR